MMDLLELKVVWVVRELMEHLVLKELLVRAVILVLRELQGLLVRRVHREYKDQPGTQDQREPLGLQDLWEIKASLVPWG
jgi:hypothetical protein